MRDTGWFKSSFSGGGDDNCVEVRWIKSSFSGAADDNCVEVRVADSVGVRDSKNPDGGALSVTFDGWSAFLRRSATSIHDH
jgi:uncharacterized protein DUF397